jgi:hypothetical protein
MSLLASALDHKSHVIEYDGRTQKVIHLMGAPGGDGRLRRKGDPDHGPQAFCGETVGSDYEIPVHFHYVNQFQVFTGGNGTVGHHDAKPLFVHYADAYTPYGPIRAPVEGCRFLTIRETTDPAGAQWMPAARERRLVTNGRQLRGQIDPEVLPRHDEPSWFNLIEADVDGLSAQVVSIGPRREFTGMSRPVGGDTFYLVARGSLELDGRDHPEPSLLHVPRDEAAPTLRAGDDGVVCIVLSFPQTRSETDDAAQ